MLMQELLHNDYDHYDEEVKAGRACQIPKYFVLQGIRANNTAYFLFGVNTPRDYNISFSDTVSRGILSILTSTLTYNGISR